MDPGGPNVVTHALELMREEVQDRAEYELCPVHLILRFLYQTKWQARLLGCRACQGSVSPPM